MNIQTANTAAMLRQIVEQMEADNLDVVERSGRLHEDGDLTTISFVVRGRPDMPPNAGGKRRRNAVRLTY